MFAFKFAPPRDPHTPFVPIIEEKIKSKPKAKPEPKIKIREVKEEPIKEEPKIKVKKVKEEPIKEEPKPEPIKEEPKPEPIKEEPKTGTKNARLIKGSPEAIEWAKMMREKRLANKESKPKSVSHVIWNYI